MIGCSDYFGFGFTTLNRNMLYLINKPLQGFYWKAGVSEENAQGCKIVRKWTIGQETKFQRKLWNLKDMYMYHVMQYIDHTEINAFVGDAVAYWIVSWTLDWEIWVQARTRSLCCDFGQDTLL